jgi:hypothetical protein
LIAVEVFQLSCFSQPKNDMRNFFFLLLLLASLVFQQGFAQEKHRLFVLTDIENEPDDAQSMVRLLLYSNVIDIEGLVATTSTHLRDKTAEYRIQEIVEAYGKVRGNLLLHESGYPEMSYLTSIIKKGVPRYGMQGVGVGHDSEGADWLIQAVDKEDDRPLWVSVWGGANVLAQALWKVRESRSASELAEFVSKIRVYTISDQDDSAPWIRKEFPDLFYIVSPGENYLHATWSGISGERWYKFASGADTTKILNPWLRENIMEGHGPLGAEYPPIEYAMEGDTPSFLSLIPNGLNDPERPDFGGWGGRYEWYTPRYLPYHHLNSLEPESRPIWTDASDEVVGNDGKVYIDNHATIWRWRDAYQNDFAARMDWTVQPKNAANHPPVASVKGPLEVNVKVGESIQLDASSSTDPDGDELQYRWIHYPEPGNYWYPKWIPLKMENANSAVLLLGVDNRVQLAEPQNTHIILQVTDQGEPQLTRYQRVIVNILPQ